jgi:hypothetical protein
MPQHNLGRTNISNLHLRRATFVLSDFVTSNVHTSINFGITSFLKRDRTPTFIRCMAQSMNEDNCWDGASIMFSDQDRLEQHFSKTIRDVADFLNSKEYYGVVGIDVLEDVKGKQWAVDMNVRLLGSLYTRPPYGLPLVWQRFQ